MTFTPTPEQTAAIDLARTGQSYVIQAGAGTGKTATLRLVADALSPARGQYLAFNRPIVQEAKTKFPKNVRCNTAHGLAFREVGKQFMPRIDRAARVKSTELAARLGVDSLSIEVAGARKTMSKSFLAGLVLRSVARFCQTADEEPTRRHVPYIDQIDVATDGVRSYENNRLVAEAIEPYLRVVWADWSRPTGNLPYQTKSNGHSTYLKVYQLSSPRIHTEFILFDEAQDANPVMQAIVAEQDHAQVIWVGDSCQQIYSFTGAVDALAKVDGPVTYLTQSFRFGPEIAEQANVVLSMLPDAQLRLSGTPTIESRVEPVERPDAILTRTNATAVRHLIAELAAGRRPHIVGGATDIISFARAARDLIAGERVDHPELACFDSWAEVIEYVEDDEQGGDLRLFVTLIQDFGVEEILAALAEMPDERNADIVISTAHKSKGREWGSVALAEDFPESRAKAGPEELRLLYVAVTRAQILLDVTSVALLADEPGPTDPSGGGSQPVSVPPTSPRGGQHSTPPTPETRLGEAPVPAFARATAGSAGAHAAAVKHPTIGDHREYDEQADASARYEALRGRSKQELDRLFPALRDLSRGQMISAAVDQRIPPSPVSSSIQDVPSDAPAAAASEPDSEDGGSRGNPAPARRPKEDTMTSKTSPATAATITTALVDRVTAAVADAKHVEKIGYSRLVVGSKTLAYLNPRKAAVKVEIPSGGGELATFVVESDEGKQIDTTIAAIEDRAVALAKAPTAKAKKADKPGSTKGETPIETTRVDDGGPAVTPNSVVIKQGKAPVAETTRNVHSGLLDDEAVIAEVSKKINKVFNLDSAKQITTDVTPDPKKKTTARKPRARKAAK